MENIVGYICSTPGAPSRVPPPALVGRPFCLPSPTGGRTPAPAQPPPDSASSCGPARVSPPSFPRCRARSWRPSTPQTRSPDAGARTQRALDEAACVATYAALGLPEEGEKVKGVP